MLKNLNVCRSILKNVQWGTVFQSLDFHLAIYVTYLATFFVRHSYFGWIKSKIWECIVSDLPCDWLAQLVLLQRPRFVISLN